MRFPSVLALGLALASQATMAAPLDPDVLGKRAEDLLQAGAFVELEKLGTRYRAEDARVPGGNAALYHYYGALASSAQLPVFSFRSAMPFDAKLKLLEAWVAARPHALQARVSLAQLWQAFAWFSRGDAARTAAALDKAGTLLAGLPNDDPHVYFLRIDGAKLVKGQRPQIDAWYGAAVKAFPTYYHYYSQRASILEEHWHGRKGDLSRFLASLSTTPGGDVGRIAYAYAANQLMNSQWNFELLEATGLVWSSVKAAYAARERKYGLRNRDWNALCKLAIAAKDRDAAMQALDHVGTDWDPAVWREKKDFDDAVTWIRQAQVDLPAEVRWTFPPGFEHSAPTPDFRCTGKGEDCKVGVMEWNLEVGPAGERKRLVIESKPRLADAVEASAEVQRYGKNGAVEYVALTHKDPKSAHRFLTEGYYNKGPVHIYFSHISNNEDDRKRFLEIIHSAQVVDGVGVLSKKLDAYVEVCAQFYPALAERNRKVFAQSIFGRAGPRRDPEAIVALARHLQFSARSITDRVCGELGQTILGAQESLE